MTPAFDPQHVRSLVSLALELGDLRAKFAGAQARLQEQNLLSALDEDGEEVMAAARRSECELAAIGASILRRMDADGVTTVLALPLNKYEEAHLDMARQHAQAIDDYCARTAN